MTACRAMSGSSLSPRQFLCAGAAAGAALVVPSRAPAFVRSRPQLTHGIQSGDVTADAGFVWARADRPSRMLVEVAPAKSKVCETLDDFRGAFAYNMLDENLRAFAAQVPQVNQWDDHETHNNWYPGQILADDRYTEKRADVLAARARQAFFEWLPIAPRQRDEYGRIYRRISHGPLLDVFMLDMRTYKDPNGPDVYADPTVGMLGPAQRAWLKRELAASRATWKVIANDLPLGLVVPDTPGTFEGVSQGDGGPPLGRELEFADVLQGRPSG